MSHRTTAPVADPNVTPMIDVLLVLLITFMMVISMRPAIIPTQLPPPPDGSVTPRQASPLVLTIEAGPRYALNRQAIAPSALASTLANVFAPRPDKVLFVAGQPGATYQEVITAMDVARGAGVRVLGIAPKSTVR